MLKYTILFLLTLGSSLLFTPCVRSLARRFGALDSPGERKIHGEPVPRLGGLSIFVVFNLFILLSSRFEFFRLPPHFLKEFNFGWIFLASAIVLGMGLVDDFRRLSPGTKLVFQIVAGVIVALICPRIEVISTPFGSLPLGNWSVPVTVFWVVGITNAINLLDGLDGLAAGTSLIVSLAIFAISLFQQDIGFALLSVVLAGSLLGFLKYNFHPASIFLGDSGAYFLGFILSVLSIFGSLKGTTTFTILVPLLTLGLPIMDTFLSMVRRLLKSLHILEVNGEKNLVKLFFFNRWTIFKADKDHIHHRLLKMGFTQRKAVALLYAISLILGGIALSSVYFRNINQALLITTIGIASYIGVRKLGYSEIQILRNGVLLPLFDAPVVNRRILRVFFDMALIAFSYYGAFLLRYEGEFDPSIKGYYLSTIPFVLAVKVAFFYFSDLYRRAWRYASTGDLLRIAKAVTLGCLASGLLLWIIPGVGIRSLSVLMIDFNLLFLLVAGTRSSFRILEHLHTARNRQGKRVLIYGVGKEGIHALNEFIDNPHLDLNPVGFVDDEGRNEGKMVNGYPVLGTLDSLENVLVGNSVSEIIVSRDDVAREKLDRLARICFAHKIQLRRFQTSLREILLAP